MIQRNWQTELWKSVKLNRKKKEDSLRDLWQHIQVQEAQSLKQDQPKKNHNKNIIIKMVKIKNKERKLKAPQ